MIPASLFVDMRVPPCGVPRGAAGAPPVRRFLVGGAAMSVSMLGLVDRFGVLMCSSASSAEDDSDDRGDSGNCSLIV
jgi:hypothetical protein